MAGIKQYLEIHSAALSLRNKKNEIIASNIANAATPNYKARDLDFNSEMSRHLKSGNLTTTNNKHFSLMRPVSHKGVSYREPLQQSLDGNTVELAVEQMEFSENSIKYSTTLSFLNSKISGLMSAIRGE
ncbi:MAG: flagellar basal body rod protein FlgB [Candidatus Puniceispirillales bacterium]|jgi:flagellar basal-body rod protein FlgB|tara:strand:- start:258 stop:644 length:387 start_codon:yes stop_codon:yes gene_type:complete